LRPALREAGIDLRAVLAFDTIFNHWAAQEGILCLPSLDALRMFLREKDWLISIVSPMILPTDLIERVLRV
jgi:hypothetical protein